VAGLRTEPQGLTAGLLTLVRPSVAPSAGSGDPRRTLKKDSDKKMGDKKIVQSSRDVNRQVGDIPVLNSLV
jgi:hypothetical protein